VKKNSENEGSNRQAWEKIVAKAWKDPTFKKTLKENPGKVLRENGFRCNPEKEYKLVENSDRIEYIILPFKPHGAEDLSEEDIRRVSGGDAGTKV
jgi:hypothetical protein